jgi:hypothetical protein
MGNVQPGKLIQKEPLPQYHSGPICFGSRRFRDQQRMENCGDERHNRSVFRMKCPN